MKKRTLFLLFFVVLFGGGIVAVAFFGGGTQNNVPANRTNEEIIALKGETLPITLLVEKDEYQVDVEQNSSVYDAMVKASKTSSLSFEGTQFAELGFFLEEINGLRQSSKLGKYWIYYINGQKAEVGISMYKLQAYDVISFKYENEE